MPSALQDAEHIAASFRHMVDYEVHHEPTYYWDNHMCASFMVDPLGLALLPRIGVEQGDVVHGLSPQRRHVRLQQPVA